MDSLPSFNDKWKETANDLVAELLKMMNWKFTASDHQHILKTKVLDILKLSQNNAIISNA
jgi:hypothetical protein